jgi:hypothetical protein
MPIDPPSSMVQAFAQSAPHKVADNDNDDPPALPARVAVPLPVPGFEPVREPRWP